ncbi:hypothetical protein S83_024126 [Arachis hypogaea]
MIGTITLKIQCQRPSSLESNPVTSPKPPPSRRPASVPASTTSLLMPFEYWQPTPNGRTPLSLALQNPRF